MEQILHFSSEKENYLKKLKSCKEYIESLENNLEVDLEFYKNKISKAIEELDNTKIKVVLFGGFSDGKSTILAALTENLEIEIAPQPTTDKIQVYEYRDLLLVDTPGLFSENIPHDELTKEYISEADLIIFTTDAVNPLKESQHEVIRWILRDLGKLSQTIFVINKIDTIADLYSPEDFKKVCNIKKEAVKKTLNKILNQNREDYIIICLSADPWGMGLDYWFKQKDEYRKLSNLEMLEKVIDKTIHKKGSILKEETIKSILKDISIKSNKEFGKEIKNIKTKLQGIEISYRDLKNQLTNLKREVNKASLRINKRIDALRKNILISIDSCNDFECLKDFLLVEIGKEGNVLQNKINTIIKEEIEDLYEYLDKTSDIAYKLTIEIEEIETSIQVVRALSSDVIKLPGKFLKSVPVNKLRDSIIKTRDILKIPYKFKSWEAVKWARFLKWAGPIFEALPAVMKYIEKEKFRKFQQEVKENLNNCLVHLLDNINYEFIIDNFLPSIKDLENELKEIEIKIQDYRSLLQVYNNIQKFLQKCTEKLS